MTKRLVISLCLLLCVRTAYFYNIDSDSILDSIATQHKDAEITFATHLDPHEQDREPFVMNDGKCILVFPPFPNRNAYGCFHIKTLLIRFKDRLRVVISSSNLFTPDWTKWSQGVWMQVLV